MGEIKALTGLRAVGAAWVLAFHLCLALGLSDAHGLLLRGYLAVDMFFILSGFVLARSYGSVFARDRSLRAYAGFVAARFVRLWPLYAVVLLSVLAVRALCGAPPSWPNQIGANLLMIQAWGLSGSIVLPGWSVSTEWAASLLFPLLALPALQSRRTVALAALVVAIAALVAAAILARSLPHGRRGDLDVYDGWSLLPVARCLAGTLVGMLAYRAASQPRIRQWLAGRWPALLAATLFVAGASAGVADAWLYPLLPVLVAGLASGGGALARMLASPALTTAGRLSYAVYLVHLPVMEAAAGLGLAWPVVPPLVLALAAIAHLAVEQPVRTWWHERGWRPAPPQPALT